MTVSVSMPEGLVKMIDRAAKREKRSRSELVRRALEGYFDEDGPRPEWREKLVVELLRSAAISAGQATALLGISKWDVIELMAEHKIPMADGDAESLRKEVAVLTRSSESRR